MGPILELSQRTRRLIGRLAARKSRVRERLVLVEGVRAVRAALDASAGVRFLVVSPKLDATPPGAALHARLWMEGHEVHTVSDRELGDLSETETSQGIMLVASEPEHGLEVVVDPGRYLLLDGVRDPGNAGTLVRAAAAFGLDAVVCLDGTVDVWGPKAVRAAAGLAFSLPVVRCGAIQAVERLEEVGVGLLVADAEGQAVDTLAGMHSFALVVGNEGAGVREAISAHARASVAVPMPGPAESLNVGVAGSILLYSLIRKTERG